MVFFFLLTHVPLGVCTTVYAFIFLVAGSGLLPVSVTSEAAGTALARLSPGARLHSSPATGQLHCQAHRSGPTGLDHQVGVS